MVVNPSSRIEVLRRKRIALLITRAEQHFSKNELRLAESLVRDALSECHDHLGALEMQARILWKQENFPGLLKTTSTLIALNPFEPGYHSLRGMALRAVGQYGEAAKSLARDPNAAQQLMDLECFQAALVKESIKHDQVFAAQYTQDPVKALTDKGFYFKEREAALAWVSQRTENRTQSTERRDS